MMITTVAGTGQGSRPARGISAAPARSKRRFLERIPAGQLTTAEAADAEELRQETLAADNERIEREQKETGRGSNSSSKSPAV
jgi:hypothetical protein